MFTIILTVILIMPGNGKDIQQDREVASIGECFKMAQDWLEQDVRLTGAIGLAAGCQSTDTPEKNRS